MGGWLDAHVHAEGLRDSDLVTLARFGVEQVLVCAHEGGLERSARASGRDWSAYFDRLLTEQTKRFRKHGLRALFALGIPPSAAPTRGLEEALHDLPAFLSHPATVAVGALTMRLMDEREESVLTRQLELAEELRRPVIVAAPAPDAARGSRKLLRWLRASEVPPESILVENLGARLIPLAAGYGFRVGIEASPGRLSDGDVLSLVQSLGPRSLLLSSHGGEGAANLLAVPLAAARLREAGLSTAVVSRVARLNALRLLGRLDTGRHRG